jgi:hypothetical protein
MKRINFDEYVKQYSDKYFVQMIKMRKSAGKTVRRKPRDVDEKEILTLLLRSKWTRWIKEGKIQQTGERRYKVQI